MIDFIQSLDKSQIGAVFFCIGMLVSVLGMSIAHRFDEKEARDGRPN